MAIPACCGLDLALEDMASDLTDHVDDYYFDLITDEDVKLLPISDLKYAVELQLQEVIESSNITIMIPRPPSHDAPAVTIIAEKFFCKICMDAVPPSDEHRASRVCAHAFCTACLGCYIGVKIQDRIANVECPEEGCGGFLDPELCQGILPRDVFERWVDLLCESMVPWEKRAYCPFKGCLEMMVMDHGDVAESECPSCKQHFCAQCGVPWHAGFDCAAYRKLGKEDMKLLEKAEREKWKRCPSCRVFVEKADGCSHITCRCGFEFCYGCCVKWERAHICG